LNHSGGVKKSRIIAAFGLDAVLPQSEVRIAKPRMTAFKIDQSVSIARFMPGRESH
jgi:hypothetical protein